MLSKTTRWSSKVCLSLACKENQYERQFYLPASNALLLQAWKSFATACLQSKETMCWLPFWSARQTVRSSRRSGQPRQG